MAKTANWSDLVEGDGGYYNPGDLKSGSDTVEGWSKDVVKDVKGNQDWAQGMGYDKDGVQKQLIEKDKKANR